METEIDLNIALEFVNKEPEPVNPEIINAGAQTADPLGMIIIALLCVLLCVGVGFALYKFISRRKAQAYASYGVAKHLSPTSSTSSGPTLMDKALVMIISILFGIFAFMGISNGVKAFASNEDKPGPDTIMVYVDEQNNTIEVEDGWFKNIKNEDMLLAHTSLTIDEQCQDIEALKDCKFKVDGFDGTLYYDHPGNIDYDPINTKVLSPGEVTTLSFNFEDLTVDTVKQLFGKKVFNLELVSKDIYADTPKKTDVSYNGQSQCGVTEGEGYTLEGDVDVKDAGNYTTTATLKPNYKWQDGSTEPETFTWSINQVAASITADNKEIEYGDTDPTLTANIEGLVEGESLVKGTDYSIAREGDKSIGTYDINVTVNSTDVTKNYAFTVNKGTFKINQRTATFEWASSSFTYNGEVQVPVAAITNIVEGDDVSVDTYVPASDCDCKSAGNHSAKVSTLKGADADNYSLEDDTNIVEYSIAKAAATITADSKSITYGETIPELTASIEGMVHSESLTKGTDYKLTWDSVEKAGTYTITVSILETQKTNNYSFTCESGTLTISQYKAVFNWATPSFTYNGETQIPTATITKAKETDDVSIKTYEPLEGFDGISAGDQKAKVLELAGESSENYSLTDTSNLVEYSIAKAQLSVTTNDVTKKYDGTPLMAAASVTGLQHDEVLIVVNTGEQTDVGESDNTYSVMWDDASTTAKAKNYEITEQTLGKLTVTKRSVKITSKSGTHEYDGNEFKVEEITIEGDGFANGEGGSAGTYSSITEIGEISNEFVFTLNANTNKDNYDIEIAYGTLKVTAATITVTAPDQSYIYDALPHGAAITASNKTNTPVTITYSLDGSTYTSEVPKITNVAESDEEVLYKAVAENYEEVTGSYKLIITPYDISKNTNSYFAKTVNDTIVYDAQEHSVDVSATFKGTTLTKDTDYEVICDKKINASGTADYAYQIKGKNNLSGDSYGTWHILSKSFGDYISITQTKDLVYNFNEINVVSSNALKVTDTTLGKDLTIDVDYKVVSGQTATNASNDIAITIEGMGNYQASKSGKWAILPKDMTGMEDIIQINDSDDPISLEYDSTEHNVDVTKVAIKSTFPGVTNEIPNGNYEISCDKKIEANDASTEFYTYKVNFKQNFTGSVDMKWVITPKQIDFLEIYGNRGVFTYDEETTHKVKGYLAKAYEKVDGQLNEISFFKDSDDTLTPKHDEVSITRKEVGKSILDLSQYAWKSNRNFKLPSDPSKLFFDNGYITVNPSDLMSATFTGTCDEAILGASVDYKLTVKNEATEGSLTDVVAVFDIWEDNITRVEKSLGTIEAGSSSEEVSVSDIIKDTDFDTSASPAKVMHVTINYKYGESDLANSFETSNSLQRNKVDKPVVQNFTFCNAEVGYPDTDDYTVTGDAKRTNVGDYECIARLNHNYLCWQDGTIAQFEFDYKIIKAKVKVTAKDSSITYGDAAKNEGCDFEGVAEGDTSAETWTPNYSYQNASGEAYTQYASGIGNYKIIPSGLSASNYDFQYVEGKMTVSAKKISLSWSSSKIQYTGEGVAPTASISGDFDGYRTAVSSYQYTVRGTEDWTSEKPKELGLYTAKAVALNSDNYVLPDTVTRDFEIFEGRKVYAKVETTTGDNPHQKLTIKYDDQSGANDILIDDEPSNDNSMFSAYASTVKEVSFDPSLASYKKIKSTKNWFAGFTNLETVSGFENFDTTALTSIEGMFNGCTSLATINLSGFKTKSDTTCTNAFAGATALAEVTVGANWNCNLGTCALDGDNWLDVNANCLSPANLPVGTTAIYTKAKYAISFEFNQDDVGEIEEGTSEIYFNDAHEAKIEVNAQNTNIINITVKSAGGSQDKTYTKTAKATDNDWRFKNWTFNPELTETICSGNTIATVNFEKKEFPKAVFTNDNKLVFKFDNTDYTAPTDCKNVFAVKNTNYTGAASDVLPEWIDATSKMFTVTPTEIVFDSSFKEFTKYRVSGADEDFTSVSAWFMNLPSACTSISGLDNITSNVNNYSYLFANASSISALDFSGLSVDGTKAVSNMFAGCSSLNEITFGNKWAVNFSSCGLPGEIWLNSAGTAFAPTDIVVPPAANVTYTLADKKIQFNKPVEKYGKIDSYVPIYFNDNFETKYVLSGQDNLILTITVGEQSYDRTAQIVGEHVTFGGWTLSPVPEVAGTITQNTTFTANFSLKAFAKAVLYGTDQADGALKFFYDDVDHEYDDDFKMQFDVINTSFDTAVYPKWFTNGVTSIQPTSIEFDETFKSSANTTSTSGWFVGFTSATSIKGMENIPTSVVNTSYMFKDFANNSCLSFTGNNELKLDNIFNSKWMFASCSSISSLDLSSFNMAENVSKDNMFTGCSSLKTFTFDDSWKCGFGSTGLEGYWISNDGLDYAIGSIPASSSSVTYTYADKTISFVVDPSDKGRITEEAGGEPSTNPIHFNSNHKVTVFESGTDNNLLSINIYNSGSSDTIGNTIKKKASPTDATYKFNGWSYNPAISGEITDNTTVTANFVINKYAKAVYDSSSETLTFKYDGSTTAGEYKLYNTSYSETENANVLPEWFNGTTPKIQPKSIVFAQSFAEFTSYISESSQINFNSMSAWFMNFTSLESVTGINYIDSCVENMTYMFKGCTKLTHADLSNFVASDETKVSNMFTGCTSINKLTIGTAWKVTLDSTGLYNKHWLNPDLESFATSEITVPPASEAVYKLADKEVALSASGANVKFINEDTHYEVETVYYNSYWTLEINTGRDEQIKDSETYEYGILEDYVEIKLTSVNNSDSKIIKCKLVFDDESDYLTKELLNWTISQDHTSVMANYDDRAQAQAVYYSDGRMVFYYDNEDHASDENFDSLYTITNTNWNNGKYPSWTSLTQKPNIHPSRVVFDESFANFNSYSDNNKLYAFRSISGWFSNFDSVSSFEGLNFVPSCIEDASCAFKAFDTKSADGCINLGTMKLPNLKNATDMFSSLPYSVKKVVAPNVDNLQRRSEGDEGINCTAMFNSCNTLREVVWNSSLPVTSKQLATETGWMFNDCYMLSTIDCSALYIGGKYEVSNTLVYDCYTLSKVKFNLDIPFRDAGYYAVNDDWNWYDESHQSIDVSMYPFNNDAWYFKPEVVDVTLRNAYKQNGDSVDGGGYYTETNHSVNFSAYIGSYLVYDGGDDIKLTYDYRELFSIPLVFVYPYGFRGFECQGDVRPEIEITSEITIDAYFFSEEMASRTSKWCFDEGSRTLTLYYDNVDHLNAQEFTINTERPDDVPWYGYRDRINNIVIDESFASCSGLNNSYGQSVPFTSIAYWFSDIVNYDEDPSRNHCSIHGLENIKAGITNASYLFANSNIVFDNDCIDLSKTNLTKVVNAENMLNLSDYSKSLFSSIQFPDNAFSEGEDRSANVNSIFGPIDELYRREEFRSLTNIYLGEGFGKNIEDFEKIFGGLRKLRNINTENINFENARNCSAMFFECINLETIDFENCNFDNVTSTMHLFNSCSNLKSVNFGNNTFPNLLNAGSMFYCCSSLEEVDLSKLCSPYLEDTSYMFYECISIKQISLNSEEGNDPTGLSNLQNMFYQCSLLATLNWSNCINAANDAYDWRDIFKSCLSFKESIYIPVRPGGSPEFRHLTPETTGLVDMLDWAVLTYGEEQVDTETDFSEGGYIVISGVAYVKINRVNDNADTISVCATKNDRPNIAKELNMSYFSTGTFLYLDSSNTNIIQVIYESGYADTISLSYDERIGDLNFEWLLNGEKFPKNTEIPLDETTDTTITANIKQSTEIPKTGKALFSKRSGILKFVYDDAIYDDWDAVMNVGNGPGEWQYMSNYITKITFDETFKDFTQINQDTPFTSMAHWFEGFGNVESITGWENIPHSVADASYMFRGFVPKFEVFDLSEAHFDNLENASGMFSYFGNFGVEPSLQTTYTLKLPNNFASNNACTVFDTDGQSIFQDSYLQTIEFGQNSFTNTKHFENMFKNCYALNSIDLSNFGTKSNDDSDLIYIDRMFYQCYYLYSVKFWNSTTHIASFNELYVNDSCLSFIDMASLDFSSAEQGTMIDGDHSYRISKFIVGGWNNAWTLSNVGFVDIESCYYYPWYRDGYRIGDTCNDIRPEAGCIYTKNIVCDLTIAPDYDNYAFIEPGFMFYDPSNVKKFNVKSFHIPVFASPENEDSYIYGACFKDPTGAQEYMEIFEPVSNKAAMTIGHSQLVQKQPANFEFDEGIEVKRHPVFSDYLPCVRDLEATCIVHYVNGDNVATGKVVICEQAGSLKATFYYDTKDHTRDGEKTNIYPILNTAGDSKPMIPWVEGGFFSYCNKIVIDKSFANCTYLADEYGVLHPFSSIAGWFRNINTADVEGLEYINGENLRDASHLFEGAYRDAYEDLSLDLSKLDTSHVTNMDGMFMGSGFCYITLSGKFASSAESICEMFAECGNLREIDLRSFNTNNFVDEFSYDSSFAGIGRVMYIKVGANWHLPFTIFKGLGDIKWIDSHGEPLGDSYPQPNQTYTNADYM